MNRPATSISRTRLRLLERLADAVRPSGKALVMVVHDINLAARYCDHALLLADGVTQAGPAHELLRAERLSAVFGVALQAMAGPHGSVFIPE